MLILDHDLLHTITNHPVHIIDSNGKMSPSAFIPFCSFGKSMEIVGMTLEGFNDPVCNSFVPTVHHNQLCYKIDLENFRNNKETENQLKYGLILILDYNENKQFVREHERRDHDELQKRHAFLPEEKKSVSIHLDTISKGYFFFNLCV